MAWNRGRIKTRLINNATIPPTAAPMAGPMFRVCEGDASEVETKGKLDVRLGTGVVGRMDGGTLEEDGLDCEGNWLGEIKNDTLETDAETSNEDEGELVARGGNEEALSDDMTSQKKVNDDDRTHHKFYL